MANSLESEVICTTDAIMLTEETSHNMKVEKHKETNSLGISELHFTAYLL